MFPVWGRIEDNGFVDRAHIRNPVSVRNPVRGKMGIEARKKRRDSTRVTGDL